MKKIFVLPDVLIKCMLCLVGIVALNMAHSLGDELPALYGLETGGEVILIIPCMGWSLFILLPLAHYAARTHMYISRLGYAELIRYGTYSRWRWHSFRQAAVFCLIYTFVGLASQLMLDGRYLADAVGLTRGLASAGLIFVSLIMQCAVFQLLYLKTMHGEKILVVMILLNIAGAALGYVLPAVSIFIPASWTMFARSGAYIAGGYSIAVILPIELAIIACVLFIKPQIDSSAFIPRNQAK